MSRSVYISHLPEEIANSDDPVERRLVDEYGAIYVTRLVPPDRIIFADETDVTRFQDSVEIKSAEIGGLMMELQTEAMNALIGAATDAANAGLSISPRGEDSARRNYQMTVELWASRVEPALDHWVTEGRLTSESASRIRSLPRRDQVRSVLELEEDGIFFAKDLSKSILYSVAPPGASQHLSMLAFDVAEFRDPRVRRVACRPRLASNRHIRPTAFYFFRPPGERSARRRTQKSGKRGAGILDPGHLVDSRSRTRIEVISARSRVAYARNKIAQRLDDDRVESAAGLRLQLF